MLSSATATSVLFGAVALSFKHQVGMARISTDGDGLAFRALPMNTAILHLIGVRLLLLSIQKVMS
jgi:hypothetical protein